MYDLVRFVPNDTNLKCGAVQSLHDLPPAIRGSIMKTHGGSEVVRLVKVETLPGGVVSVLTEGTKFFAA